MSSLILATGAVALGAFLSHRHRLRTTDNASSSAKRQPPGDLALVGRSVTIRQARAKLFEYWRDFSNLPKFMENLESIEDAGANDALMWNIKAPAGRTVSVTTEIDSEKQDEHIAWRSVEGSDLEPSGEVRFEDAPGDRGTRVSLTMSYDPPGGALGQLIAKLFQREPQVQTRHDLKRFKMLMETGEIATSVRTNDETRVVKQENG